MNKELLREFVTLLIETGHMWSDLNAKGEEDDLELDEPQLIVEPEVRDAIKSYFRAMGLTKASPRPNKRASFGRSGCMQDSGKSNLWRDNDNTPPVPIVKKLPRKK